ncbi:MAG: Gfo/Idh/MocA family oxidoreductase, partial [Geminicoccaceae bacterium]
LPDVALQVVVDPRLEAAKSVAKRWGIPGVHDSLEAALALGDLDCVHVLTPPDLHEPMTRQALEAGLPVLVEKPLTPARTSSLALATLADETGLTLGVNQNFLYHPAFARMRAVLESGALGRLNNLTCLYRMPLRQLQGRQFGHWMFQAPQNLLLEQAVHPLSQIKALVPAAALGDVRVGERLTLGPDRDLLLAVDAGLSGPEASVQFHFALGADFPHWELIASCTDGVIHADIVNNRCHAKRRTRWLEPTDQLLSGLRSAVELGGAALSNAIGYGLSMVKLKARSDAYYLSMKGAIGAYHQALDRKQKPFSDARFAADLVDLSEQIAEAGGARIHAVQAAKPTPAPVAPEHDLLLIGGTGFIGRAIMTALAGRNLKIAVLARNLSNLPPVFSEPNVTLIRGSFNDPVAIDRAMTGCRQVVHLAHGMGSGGDLIETMRAGTRLIAEKSLEHGVERLVYISSIAALY